MTKDDLAKRIAALEQQIAGHRAHIIACEGAIAVLRDLVSVQTSEETQTPPPPHNPDEEKK